MVLNLGMQGMMTVGELIETCNNDWETIHLYSEKSGLIGIYRQKLVMSETRRDRIVVTWYWKEDEKALYISI